MMIARKANSTCIYCTKARDVKIYSAIHVTFYVLIKNLRMTDKSNEPAASFISCGVLRREKRAYLKDWHLICARVFRDDKKINSQKYRRCEKEPVKKENTL